MANSVTPVTSACRVDSAAPGRRSGQSVDDLLQQEGLGGRCHRDGERENEGEADAPEVRAHEQVHGSPGGAELVGEWTRDGAGRREAFLC